LLGAVEVVYPDLVLLYLHIGHGLGLWYKALAVRAVIPSVRRGIKAIIKKTIFFIT
jgi:hypothetical protein